MQTQTNNPIVISDEKFVVTVENVEGFIFLHLSLDTITSTIVKKLRLVLDMLLREVEKKGHDIIFATTSNEKILKLWNLIKPCFETTKVGKNAWVGSWVIEEGAT